ncbi:MAG: SRPBCC domain-containing protein [Pseudolabrys sp.]|nr:SRPBCC domain-containing protein [Pseudolabrys sp.]
MSVAAVEPFVISRTLNAPRDIVWDVVTKPEHMGKWFGPKGFPGVHAKMDFRVGGMYHYGLKSPDGSTMWGRFIYREIDPKNKIVFVNSFSDEKGGITTHPMAPTWPRQMLSTFAFEDVGPGKTKFTVTWIPLEGSSAEEIATFDERRTSAVGGWTGTFEQLEAYLADIQK